MKKLKSKYYIFLFHFFLSIMTGKAHLSCTLCALSDRRVCHGKISNFTRPVQIFIQHKQCVFVYLSM